MLQRVKELLNRAKTKYWEIAAKLPVVKNLAPKKQTLVIGTVIPLALVLLLLIYLYWDLPLPSQLTSEARNPVSTQILDRNGKLVYEIYETKRRTPIKIEDLPPYVGEATIAVEDKDFYKHHGVSFSGMARALLKITTKQELQGGSTITQQLVKTTLLSPDRTLRRKVRELTLTLLIELLNSKNKILEMYLNNVPYGGTAWGIEEAARTYFDKSASDLTLGEAALLAGLPAAPTRLSPFGTHPELAAERQKLVLGRMVEDKYITPDERDKAIAEVLSFAKPEAIKAPHFALLVKEQLVEKYGEDRVEHGGLRVRTTLDLDLQDFAQNTVASEVGKLKKERVGNGAALIANPKTGEIYVMVGSKDYFAEDEDGKVNITISKRQPGSSIKPLNYAMALMNGKITAATPLADLATCFTNFGQPLYCPQDYDNKFRGAAQARFALGNSLNVPAVRVLALNTVQEFVFFARHMGISTFEDPSRYGLSLTLGGGEVKMTDMVQAFSSFADSGIKPTSLVSILEVKDWQGNVLETTNISEGERVIPEGVAYIISHILLDNNARSMIFGTTSYLNISGHPEVSVKTGTTQNLRDNWTIGFTPEVVAATWVGNNDNTPMSRVASGVTGASPIWNKIIKQALGRIEAGELAGNGEEPKKHTHVWPEKPDDVEGTNVCADTGTLPPGLATIQPAQTNPESAASPGSQFLSQEQAGCALRFEFFLKEHPPKPATALNKTINVFKDTGMPSPPDALPEQIEPKEHQVLTDPLGTDICLDCPLPTWSITINPDNLPQQ